MQSSWLGDGWGGDWRRPSTSPPSSMGGVCGNTPRKPTAGRARPGNVAAISQAPIDPDVYSLVIYFPRIFSVTTMFEIYVFQCNVQRRAVSGVAGPHRWVSQPPDTSSANPPVRGLTPEYPLSSQKLLPWHCVLHQSPPLPVAPPISSLWPPVLGCTRE